ncbi:MAG TPA: DUF4340 domain-containing protein [Bryobacteraceae bacterium]|jgi:hypothetical protein
MQVRGLLIGAAVLALLGGGVYWSNKSKEAESKSGPKDASPKVLALQESDIAQLDFLKKGMPPVVVKRAGEGKWTITEPKPLPADTDAVAAVTGVLANFSSETVAPAPADLSPFGLKDPLFTLKVVKKDGKQIEVEVGDNVPVTGSVFVKVAGDPRVFTVGSFNRTALDKQWSDLRDKRLLPVDSDKLSRVEISANGKSVEFGKNQAGEWQIVKPNPYRADTWGVEELVRKLKDAKLDPAAPAADLEKATKEFASDTPVATAKLTDASGTQQLEIRKSKDKEPVYYAKSSAVDGVYKVPADLATALSKPVMDYRNKKLFDFGFTDPSKLEIKVDGKTKACGKNGEKWICDNKEVKPETVSAFVDKIRDLSAKQFIDNPEKIAAPDIEITVLTAEGKKSETVRIAGNRAARGDEPAMYELDPSNVDGIRQAFSAIKEPAAGAQKK